MKFSCKEFAATIYGWTRQRVNSVRYGTKSVFFLAPKIWDILPKEIKNSEKLNGFKLKIKNRVPQGCPLRFCKTNVSQVATPKTWTQILDSDPGPRTRKIWTLKNQDPEKPGLRKTWILENLNSENPGLWKTWETVGCSKED